MESVWAHLPDALALHVISFMNIDTRLSFGVRPRRIPKDSLKIALPVYEPNEEGFILTLKVPNAAYLILSRGQGILYSWIFTKGTSYSVGNLFVSQSGKITSDLLEF